MSVKYSGLTLGQIEAVVNKLGGVEGVRRLLSGEATVVFKTNIIPIRRGNFNPAKFIGKGWSIITGETDTRPASLAELDLTKVQQVTMLKDGETYIKGEEKLKRLKASDYIRLDADIFFTLWENQHLIPESWKEKVNGNTRYIFFDGTFLRDSGGLRCVLWPVLGWRCVGLARELAGRQLGRRPPVCRSRKLVLGLWSLGPLGTFDLCLPPSGGRRPCICSQRGAGSFRISKIYIINYGIR